MPFDPRIHHRRSVRLGGYDYAQPGAYFITVCIKDRACLLGSVTGGQACLSAFGEVVAHCWRGLPDRFPRVGLDECAVLPNHLHGIIVLRDGAGELGRPPAGATSANPRENEPLPDKPVSAPTLGQVVACFKYLSTKRVNELRGTWAGPLWQRSYYEHVIRSETSLRELREYIATNALQWEMDTLHAENPSRW